MLNESQLKELEELALSLSALGQADAEIQAAQATWDAQSDEEKAALGNTRPTDVILP